MSTVRTLLTEGTATLSAAGIADARAEARLLLAHVSGLGTAKLFSYPETEIPAEDASRFYDIVSRRAQRLPVAHLVGAREFWSMSFKVTPATLVPRPETETLIETALELFAGREAPRRIMDLGTGTGCILLALLRVFPEASGVALDVSAAALSVARENAIAHDLDQRASFVRADFADAPMGPFDLIVSNPPYIPSADIDGLEVEVRVHDPIGALDGGGDGLDAYRTIIDGLGARLAEDGLAVFEIGIGQGDDVAALAAAADLNLAARRSDLAGTERVLAFCKKGVGIPGAGG